MNECTVSECDNKVLAKGMCSKHYTRMRSHGDLTTNKREEFRDMTGLRFGRLVVVGFSFKRRGRRYWSCRCDCGNTKDIRVDSLTVDATVSCGCLQKESTRGYMNDKDRFMSKVKKTESCWEWQGSTLSKYGQFSVTNAEGSHKNVRAHRYSYELFVGKVGDNIVCHDCDNPSCVNPDHLFLGSQKDNIEDKMKKNRQAKGSSIGTSILTEGDIPNVRKQLFAGKSLQYIADRYEVTKQCIWNVKHGKTWRHI